MHCGCKVLKIEHNGQKSTPWYVRNNDLRRDLKVDSTPDEIKKVARRHEDRLHKHSNYEVLSFLLTNATCEGARGLNRSGLCCVRSCARVWFQNRRAKFRKQERLAQQKSSSINSDSPNPTTNIKAENNNSTKNSVSSNKDNVKPGSPHSSISTTPNSNTSSISSLHSNNSDIKPVNGISGKQSEDLISNNNKWSSMSPQSCNTALLVQQANKVLSQPSHLQSHHGSHAAAAAAAALSSPFTSLLGATGGAASYLLGDHLKPATANHLF
uniref:Homeotic protein ocelliless-like n=1 Tax=Diabrotica virgifera virgifera TaxID=50390 RepID=A0A6P7FTA0_DIAVI